MKWRCNSLKRLGNSSCGNRRNRWAISIGVYTIALVLLGSPALAPSAAAYENESGYAAYQSKALTSAWGVSSYMNIANPTITQATQSLVCAGMTIFIDDDHWIQFGYLKGWFYLNPRVGYVQATTPRIYMEVGDIGAGTSWIYTSLLAITPGTWHTFKIMFNTATWDWECWFDTNKIWTVYWIDETVGDTINVQGECKDNDDESNGVMHFHALKWLRYTYFKGTYRFPTWLDWNGYSSTGADYPWSKSSSSSAFDCWT